MTDSKNKIAKALVNAVMWRMQVAEEKAGRQGYLDTQTKPPAVPLGLRSTFHDWAAEPGIERDLAEMALAQTVGSEFERAYRRTDMLEKRRALLQRWERFLSDSRQDRVAHLNVS